MFVTTTRKRYRHNFQSLHEKRKQLREKIKNTLVNYEDIKLDLINKGYNMYYIASFIGTTDDLVGKMLKGEANIPLISLYLFSILTGKSITSYINRNYTSRTYKKNKLKEFEKEMSKLRYPALNEIRDNPGEYGKKFFELNKQEYYKKYGIMFYKNNKKKNNLTIKKNML